VVEKGKKENGMRGRENEIKREIEKERAMNFNNQPQHVVNKFKRLIKNAD